MNEKQSQSFIGLTKLQQHVVLAKLHKTGLREAYRAGGGKAATDNAMDTGINEILKHPKVQGFHSLMSEEAMERALCTTADVVSALMNEAMIGKAKDNAVDSTPASRVSALKSLTDYTGGFDVNVKKQDLTTGGMPLEAPKMQIQYLTASGNPELETR